MECSTCKKAKQIGVADDMQFLRAWESYICPHCSSSNSMYAVENVSKGADLQSDSMFKACPVDIMSPAPPSTTTLWCKRCNWAIDDDGNMWGPAD